MTEESFFVQVSKAIVQHKEFLKERMDPDFGLTSKLRARKTLSEEEIDEIKDQRPYRKRNVKIIEYITAKKKFGALIDALKDVKQTHLTNYLISNGQYKPEFGGDWPLGEKEILTIDANEENLVDLLDTSDLLSRLFSTGVINKRQMEFISSKPTSYEKNEELLKILRRSSLSSYWQTIKCLHDSNQSHIAEIFEKGGVIVQTDFTLETKVGVDVDEAEKSIVTGITNLLGNRSLPESNRILELVQLRLVGARVGHSVVLFFHCLHSRDVDRLQEICGNGEMMNLAEAVFNKLLQANGRIIQVKVQRMDFDFSLGRHNCKEFEAAERMHRQSHVIPHETTMKELPLELMDLILQKSYLGFLTIEKRFQCCSRKENFFRRMASVDFCCFQRLRKRRFKRRIWRHLAAFYKDDDDFAVYRINQNYFVENIQPKVLISRLRFSDCLSDVQARLVSRQKCCKGGRERDKKEINEELLQIVRFFKDKTSYSNFTRCFRQSSQQVVEKVAQNGGAVIKARIVPRKRTKQTELVQQLTQRLNDLNNKSKPPASDELDKLVHRLNGGQIEILNSFPDRQLVVWIWSRSQIAFDNLRSLDDQHDLVKLLSCLSKTPQSDTAKVHAAIRRRNIDIDSDQFKKTVVLFPLVVNFRANLKARDDEFVVGVTKLRGEIYILFRSVYSQTLLRAFQDIYPFYLQREMTIDDCKFAEDVASSEKGNCLYVIDTGNQCIWKIMKEFEVKYSVEKWMSIEIDWSSVLSMSKDGDLLIVRGSCPRSRLEIYEKNANCRLSIQLPPDIQFPQHAVETSTGNFIILHESIDDGEDGAAYKWLIWEVARNGTLVIRRYIPQNAEQELNYPRHLLLDSDDRVLVADTRKGRLLLLDSDLRWSRIPITRRNHRPLRLCLDEAKMQLIVIFDLKGIKRLCPRIYHFKCCVTKGRIR